MGIELKGSYNYIVEVQQCQISEIFARLAACLKAGKFKFMFTFLGGRHAMALTVDGKVFSWGEGDDGKLGHFSRM